jgi:hypothetical protein
VIVLLIFAVFCTISAAHGGFASIARHLWPPATCGKGERTESTTTWLAAQPLPPCSLPLGQRRVS